ncbi:hypothetical protein L1987_09701 [Smallanthus sonchifolius]|uniref:Uncharacterized protein n=1 Tax=Smallanthus sonchifolius TaxID=185202 RepID=A0ACB9JQ32_9ASTR|nr:hypothetical protein L1987_09701 [Smallanthus sonchifolius]
MASACVYEEKTLIHELTQGLQLAESLRVNLHSPETREFLIQKILSIYDNALLVLQSGVYAGQPREPESSVSFRSPGSEEFEFDRPFSGQQGQNVTSKKRKGSMTLEDHVIICSGNRLEDNIDDGYNWRKYGQKDILGAKFPRSYYKCSYCNSQKCFAKKQVQRKDEDSTVFDIAYKGKHTCILGVQSASPPLSPSPQNHEITPTFHQLSPPNPGEMLSNLRANLRVNTSDLGGYTDTVPSSFSFPSTSSGLMEDHHQFHFPNHCDDELWQVYSQAVISPATPESNFFTEWGSPPSLDFPANLEPLISPATTPESNFYNSLRVYSPPFISPATSESNIFTEWGSSSSLDLLTGPADVDSDFEFMNSLF